MAVQPLNFGAVSEQKRALDDSQRQELEKKAAQYEEQLQKDEKNAYALEGGDATCAALGSYEKATSLLTHLTQQQDFELHIPQDFEGKLRKKKTV